MKKILSVLAIVLSFNALAVEKFPVEHFFKEPLMLAPTLSPDGEYLAALTPYNVNRETNNRCKNRPFDKKIARVKFTFAMLQEGTLQSFTSLIKQRMPSRKLCGMSKHTSDSTSRTKCKWLLLGQ